jgi:hypothetical protein
MINGKTRLLAVTLLGLSLSPTLWAGWIHQDNAVYLGEVGTEKHPATFEQILAIPVGAAETTICIAYANNVKLVSVAKISTIVTIEDLEGNKETLTLGVRVRKNAVIKCKAGPELEFGDLVTFEHLFQGMPRLRSKEGSYQGLAITSLVSTDGTPKIGAGPLALAPETGTTPLGLVQSGESGWFHSANSIYHAEKKNDDHPGKMARAIVMPVDSVRKPLVCSGYNRVSDEKKKGKVVTSAEILRADGTTESFLLNGGVRKDQYLECQTAAKKISKGDIVTFVSNYKNMPALAKTAYADFVGVVTSTGEPAFRSEQVDVPVGPSDPGTPPPAGSTISAADERAITRMFTASKNQLIRPKGNNPAKWEVVGPRTLVDANGIVASTAGYGSTPAAALADYEKKRGSLGGTARSLSSSERAAWEWYSRMSSVSGPTAIRRDGQGKWRGDAFRPNIGVQISPPLSGVVAVVNFLKKLGL